MTPWRARVVLAVAVAVFAGACGAPASVPDAATDVPGADVPGADVPGDLPGADADLPLGGAACGVPGNPSPGTCDGRLACGILHGARRTTLGGTFARVPALEQQVVGMDLQPYTGDKHDYTSALVADFDGDGRADVLASRERGGTWLVTQPAPGVWRNAGGLAAGGTHCRFVADLDGDGRADVFCGGPDLRVLWGGPAGLGAPTSLGPPDPSGPPMAAVAWDLDEDGLLDIVVAPFGGTKRVFRNRGARTFEDVTARWGLGADGLSWAVGFLDFDGDGRLDVYMTNDGSDKANDAFRSAGPGPDGDPRFTRLYPMPAGCDPEGLFGTGRATPMGLALGDLNGDGRFELYLAMTLNDVILSPQGGGAWLNARFALALPEPTTSTGANVIHWSPALWDADHDGLLDALVPAGDDDGHGQMAGRGAETTSFFHGLPDGRFEDVRAAVGLGATGNSMTLTLADLDGDLDLDVLLGGFGQPVAAYENRLTPNGGHLLLDLRGHASNPDGLGARVTVTAGGARRVYQVGDRWGPQATAAATLDVALGAAAAADTVQVEWPSGYTQVVRGLAAGRRHVVEEPPLLAIEPASRHAPADGHTEVRVVVRPVDAAGQARPGARVALATPFGPGAWTGPEVPLPDGSVERRLRAPAVPGSAVIEVRVDGVPWRVRPRVWFD